MNRNLGLLGAPRRGAGTLELILALPALLIAVLAILQFGVLMVVQQTVVAAAHEGARAAAREPSATAARAAAVAAVNKVLDVHDLAVSPPAGLADSDAGVRLVLEYPTGVVVALEEAGDSAVMCVPPDSPDLLATDPEVRVTVSVALNQPPLLNLLKSFGFNVAGKRLQASAMAAKE